MPDKKAFSLGVLLSLLLFSGCRQGSNDGFQAIRFIDLMKEENIRRSPFLQKSEANPPALLEPLKAMPLADLGSGENPFQLKKKLDLGYGVFDIIFAPPRSIYSFGLLLPPGAVLEFGAGIIRDANFERLARTLGQIPQSVRFLVELETREGKKTVFENDIPLPEKKEFRTQKFSNYRVELPPQPQPARLTFVTRGGDGAFSFWHNPVIYTQGRRSRGIILISLDALRPDHLGCYGYSRPTSPNIDALAKDSALFEYAYAASNWTLPCHVSLLTSLSTPAHQVYRPSQRIDPSTLLLAEILRQRHFFCTAFTGAILVSSAYGFSRGFDVYRQSEGFAGFVDSAELIFRSVSDWLERNADKDFFLFLHTYQVHNPYSCPAPYNTMFLKENSRWQGLDLLKYLGGRAGAFRPLSEEERDNIIGLYDGEIRYTDEAFILPLAAKLKELGLYDQTMLIVTSDHGEEFYEHGSWVHNHNLYDESLRIPLIIKFPESKFKGKRIPTLIRQIDIMPTILETFGIKADAWQLEGRSLLSVLRGREKEDRVFLADTNFFDTLESPEEGEGGSKIWLPDKIATGTRKRKFLFSGALGDEGERKFSPASPGTPVVELYNLESDPGEAHNLAAQDPESAGRMLRRIQEIYKRAAKKKANRISVDENLKEQLRALGYIR